MKKIKETALFLWDLMAFGLVQNYPQVSLALIIVLAVMAAL